MSRAYAYRRPVENTTLVRDRDRRLLRELLVVALAVVAVGGGLLVYTWLHVETLRTGYRIDELDRELERLLEEERRWRLELAVEARPDAIEKRASEELGLRAPQVGETLFYGELLP